MNHLRSRLSRMVATAAAVAVLTVPVGATSASATVPTTVCNGQSYKSLVKTYAYGAQALALRCGTATWGFVHIKARWNAAFDSMIALTIARGEKVSDLQQDGGSVIFALFDGNCHELFRVIYNGRAYLGTGVSPQGIITAYYNTTGPVAVQVAPEAAAVAGYRTDCPVIQSI
jgi:hypothetical protein